MIDATFSARSNNPKEAVDDSYYSPARCMLSSFGELSCILRPCRHQPRRARPGLSGSIRTPQFSSPRGGSVKISEEGEGDWMSSRSLIYENQTTHRFTPRLWLYAGDTYCLFALGSFFIGLDPGPVNAEYLKRQHGRKQASHPSKDPGMNAFIMTGQEIHLRRERLFEAPAKHKGCNSHTCAGPLVSLLRASSGVLPFILSKASSRSFINPIYVPTARAHN